MAKKSLIQFERYFEQQLNVLEYTPWAPLQAKILDQLYEEVTLQFNGSDQKSFLVEIYPFIFDLFTVMGDDLQSLPPELLVRHYTRLITSDTAIKKFPNESFEHCETNGRQIIAQSYFRLLAFAHLTEFLAEQKIINKPKRDKILRQNVSEWTKEEYLNTVQGDLPEYLLTALRVELEDKMYKTNRLTGVFAVNWNDFSAGVLGEIVLENAELVRDAGSDQVRIATHLIDEQDIIALQARDVCHHLRELLGISDSRQIRLKYGINQPTSLLTGNSVGVALALLGEYGLKKMSDKPGWIARLDQQAVFTGAADNRGNVREIKDSDIPVKVEAAFYGRTRTLVIPEQHRKTAREALTELQERYPRRDLEIITVARVDDIKNLPDILRFQKVPFRRRVLRVIQNHAAIFSLIAVSLLVVLGIVLYQTILKNSEPQSIVVVQNRIVIKNKYGIVSWQSEPYGSNEAAKAASEYAAIEDLNNDGVPEILIFYDRSTIEGFRSTAACYNADGSIRWKKEMAEEVTYQDQTFRDITELAYISITDLEGNGSKEIIALLKSAGSFPSRILVLSNAGKLHSDYWHAGDLRKSVIIDDIYPGNNTKEVLLSGTNAEYKTGVVLALDPFRATGSSPQRSPYYITRGVPAGNEIYYLNLPETHFRTQFTRDASILIGPIEEDSFLFYIVNEVSTQYFDGLIGGGVYYKFGFDFRMESMNISQAYFQLYREAYPDRDALITKDPDLLNRFRKIQYWNGESWQPERTVNARYINTIRGAPPD
ncbi:MAG: hypothetical protein K9N46_01520 [Candidatus Marinimicrobia bacterium]|nr:hypothetical protein [Candidatus Neomarinimicrobiota bacterium]MCF7827844.1 hypothetical protein [Candidatus Neomarinimicrobiota bacterium]MCF7879401.1 hypothetical protein [Candidatus Neomarinimicrobiota bacterium]